MTTRRVAGVRLSLVCFAHGPLRPMGLARMGRIGGSVRWASGIMLVLALGVEPSLGEQFVYEAQALQVVAHSGSQLPARQKQDPVGGLDEHHRGSLSESGTLAHRGWHYDPTSFSHHYVEYPIHDEIVPLLSE